jgi:predicted transposase YbfD/YdcC
MENCRPLIEVLQEVPDFRKSRGKRYQLAAVLALACVATLCGYKSYGAIAEWGGHYGEKLVRKLGFDKGKTPSVGTLFTILSNLDWNALELKLAGWLQEIVALKAGTTPCLSFDGKTLRGSRRQGAEEPHILSVFCHQLGLTLFQKGVDVKTNEIPVMLEVLELITIKGRFITVDALLTQRQIALKITAAGGYYAMIVKANQPQLLKDIQTYFERVDRQSLEKAAETLDAGHGRIDERQLVCSDGLNEYLDWPGVQRVFELKRRSFDKKSAYQREETVYGIIGWQEPPPRTDAAFLLECSRGHWGIENRSHYVRDVTFDEDHSQVRVGNTHKVMTSFRNLSIDLERLAGFSNIAKACRHLSAKPMDAMRLIGVT